jgi:D-serine deaminase-like pyridoxal phosphate-dependent protein
MKKEQLDTPCLVLDLDVMQNNIDDMAIYAKEAGVSLRPMMKTHKCPAIAHMQLKAGATPGIQAAKVGEAEVMAAAGIADIFISNEIIGETKVERLVNLAKRNKISTSVDSIEGAKGLDAIAGKHSLKLNVLIHVDTGNRRTGVLPGNLTLDFAREVVRLRNLSLKGIWTHEGHNYTGRTPEEVQSKTRKAGEEMVETKQLLEKELGMEVYNSVGSTPGAKLLAKMRGVDEIRPGAYVFYDEGQVFMGICKRKDCALAVLATIISRPAPDRAVCDVGTKGYYPPAEYLAFTEKGLAANWPLPAEGGGVIRGLDGEVYEDIVFHRWGEEYGILKLYDTKRNLKTGDMIEVVPYHVCSSVNLYDEIMGIRNGELEAILPIWARGKVR